MPAPRPMGDRQHPSRHVAVSPVAQCCNSSCTLHHHHHYHHPPHTASWILAWRPCSIAPLCSLRAGCCCHAPIIFFLFPSGGTPCLLPPEEPRPHPTLCDLLSSPAGLFVLSCTSMRQPGIPSPPSLQPETHSLLSPPVPLVTDDWRLATGACRSLRYRTAGFFFHRHFEALADALALGLEPCSTTHSG
jgi:hypothetical protein